MKAYVLINVRSGKSRAVVQAIGKLQGVKSANACWGRPDVFVLVEAANEKALAESVLDRIQQVDGVESTDGQTLRLAETCINAANTSAPEAPQCKPTGEADRHQPENIGKDRKAKLEKRNSAGWSPRVTSH